jgi:hypothetical protein
MVVDGRIVNVPSDGRERPVCCSVMVLPGPDPGEAIGEPSAPEPGSTEVASITKGVARLAAIDPASSGGLADALARGALEGYRDLPAGLRAALRAFRSAGHSLPRQGPS